MGCDGQHSEVLWLFCLSKYGKKCADAFKHVESIAYHAPISVSVYGDILWPRTILCLYLLGSEVARREYCYTDHAKCKYVTILEVGKFAYPGDRAVDEEDDNTVDPKWRLMIVRVPLSYC